jgi:hypothetical protein
MRGDLVYRRVIEVLVLLEELGCTYAVFMSPWRVWSTTYRRVYGGGGGAMAVPRTLPILSIAAKSYLASNRFNTVIRRLHDGPSLYICHRFVLSTSQPLFSLPSVRPSSLRKKNLGTRREQSVVFTSSTGQATPPTSSVQSTIDALAGYAKETGIDLFKNPFATMLEQSNSLEAILRLFQGREKVFDQPPISIPNIAVEIGD